MIILYYVIFALIIVAYLYYLFSTNEDGKRITYNKKKNILRVLKKYENITRRATRQIEDMYSSVESLFYEDGSVNHLKMNDALNEIKRIYSKKQGNDDNKVTFLIDILLQKMGSTQAFYRVSSDKAIIFNNLLDQIKGHSIVEAEKTVYELYEQDAKVERELRKGKIQFIIGTAIGIMGLIPLVIDVINVLVSNLNN